MYSTRNSINIMTCLKFVAMIAFVANVDCFAYQHHLEPRFTMLAARRAADDSRPIARVSLQQAASEQDPATVVMGKFRAPAPEYIHRKRIPKTSDSMSHSVSASYRVTDDSASQPEKVVHGIVGASSQDSGRRSVGRTVVAKMQVSDEGLNYPPSKLSADIYGNVAEIVTAPPEAVESDFLVPNSSKFFGRRRAAS